MDRLKKSASIAATLILLAIASIAGWRLWGHYQLDPWTRDGRVRADIVEIAPDVSGLVTRLAVAHDQHVTRGQLLFSIDRARYEVAVRQAETAIASQKSAIAVQNALIAARRAALVEAQREAARNDGLGSLVAQEAIEQSHSKVAEDKAALDQATAALHQATVAVSQAEAARDLADLNLARTDVLAPTDGMLSDVGLRIGDYVTPGKPVMALIDSASLRVEGYFEETKLPRIALGAPVEVRLMGEEKPLSGHVQSIAGAIEDRERAPSSSLLPNVNPTFSWVRLAQRIPVRIRLDQPPTDIRLIAGRTASVTILSAKEVKP
jgi:RND family efflux transporter MFP subunit